MKKQGRGAAARNRRQAVLVLVTAASARDAVRIGRVLVEAGLAACVNVLPGLRSLFRWEGKIADEREVLMLVKSRADLFQPLAQEVRRLHHYTVPEIIAFPITHGTADYLAWIQQSTRKPLKRKRF
jgi:periplasmic divalent cation tolerance protein